jgi:hypothetical protein
MATVLATSGGGGATVPRGRCTIKGTSGRDTLVGTLHRDVICGLDEADVIILRGAGNDAVYGGRGDDVIYNYNRAGTAVLYGESGDDTFFSVGRRGTRIEGGPGHDRARSSGARVRSVEESFPVKPGPNPVVLAAGDIASCRGRGDDDTAVLLGLYPRATVATLGDTVYDSGSESEFASCYQPTWGRAKARTRPAIGDHEYQTPAAAGYYKYFGAAAGELGKGYYSYDIGSWHVVVLNSFCLEIGGCSPNSPETLWLRADLAANPKPCTLAYMHRPRFSSGTKGNRVKMQSFWQALYDARAEVVLGGDDHFYERFAPQTAAGAGDPVLGIRQFVVGTGGKSFSPFGAIQPQSEVRNNRTFGVLKLILRPTSYAWQFIPIAGSRFTDRGSEACH